MNASRLSSRRVQRTLDVLLAAWAAAWIAIGILVAHEVRGLAQLSDTVGSVGRAVTSVADVARGLPLVGSRLTGPAGDVEAAGRDAVASARATRRTAGRVGALLGVSIALIPSLPVLLLYVPGRLSAERERGALRRALRDGDDAAWLEEVLARRALVEIPYHRLRQVSPDPASDLREGRHAALAEAELRRLGIATPARRRARR